MLHGLILEGILDMRTKVQTKALRDSLHKQSKVDFIRGMSAIIFLVKLQCASFIQKLYKI